MEDTLRGLVYSRWRMERCLNPCFNGRYSQRALNSEHTKRSLCVLILVLMEDTLRVNQRLWTRSIQSLNPCFNGRYSQSLGVASKENRNGGLNPCFNGRYSQSFRENFRSSIFAVLILVLMEDTLRVVFKKDILSINIGLNPCFNGRYSQRWRVKW